MQTVKELAIALAIAFGAPFVVWGYFKYLSFVTRQLGF